MVIYVTSIRPYHLDVSHCLTIKVMSWNPIYGEVYPIQYYVMTFVSDLWQVGGFSPDTPVSSTNKTDHHDIAEILLKVALNTITLTLTISRL